MRAIAGCSTPRGRADEPGHRRRRIALTTRQGDATLGGVTRPALVPHLRRARDLADTRYAEPLDLDALAAAANVSKYHFARSFADTYGDTPMRYLTRRRIERAQDLLRTANLTVTEICMMVGFSSLGSFSSRFRELVGETPTQYRDRWAATGGPHIPGCFLFMRGVDAWPAAAPDDTSPLDEQRRRSGSLSRSVP
jgi:AraC-like DNA-binding protein